MDVLGSSATNSLLIIGGWILGALIVIVGMRGQITTLAAEIKTLNLTLRSMGEKLGEHAEALAYLKGLAQGRKEEGQRSEERHG